MNPISTDPLSASLILSSRNGSDSPLEKRKDANAEPAKPFSKQVSSKIPLTTDMIVEDTKGTNPPDASVIASNLCASTKSAKVASEKSSNELGRESFSLVKDTVGSFSYRPTATSGYNPNQSLLGNTASHAIKIASSTGTLSNELPPAKATIKSTPSSELTTAASSSRTMVNSRSTTMYMTDSSTKDFAPPAKTGAVGDHQDANDLESDSIECISVKTISIRDEKFSFDAIDKEGNPMVLSVGVRDLTNEQKLMAADYIVQNRPAIFDQRFFSQLQDWTADARNTRSSTTVLGVSSKLCNGKTGLVTMQLVCSPDELVGTQKNTVVNWITDHLAELFEFLPFQRLKEQVESAKETNHLQDGTYFGAFETANDDSHVGSIDLIDPQGRSYFCPVEPIGKKSGHYCLPDAVAPFLIRSGLVQVSGGIHEAYDSIRSIFNPRMNGQPIKLHHFVKALQGNYPDVDVMELNRSEFRNSKRKILSLEGDHYLILVVKLRGGLSHAYTIMSEERNGKEWRVLFDNTDDSNRVYFHPENIFMTESEEKELLCSNKETASLVWNKLFKTKQDTVTLDRVLVIFKTGDEPQELADSLLRFKLGMNSNELAYWLACRKKMPEDFQQRAKKNSFTSEFVYWKACGNVLPEKERARLSLGSPRPNMSKNQKKKQKQQAKEKKRKQEVTDPEEGTGYESGGLHGSTKKQKTE